MNELLIKNVDWNDKLSGEAHIPLSYTEV